MHMLRPSPYASIQNVLNPITPPLNAYIIYGWTQMVVQIIKYAQFFPCSILIRFVLHFSVVILCVVLCHCLNNIRQIQEESYICFATKANFSYVMEL